MKRSFLLFLFFSTWVTGFSQWHHVGGGIVPRNPTQMEIFQDELYFGGNFQFIDTNYNNSVSNLAKWTGREWIGIAEAVDSLGFHGFVTAMVSNNTKLYITKIKEQPQQSDTTPYHPTTIGLLSFDGVKWRVEKTFSMDTVLNISFLFFYQNELYMDQTYKYDSISDSYQSKLLKIDQNNILSIICKISGEVYSALELNNDLYVAGSFDKIADVDAINVAKYTTLTSTWSSMGKHNGVSLTCYQLLAYTNSPLVLGNLPVLNQSVNDAQLYLINDWIPMGPTDGFAIQDGLIHNNILYAVANKNSFYGGVYKYENQTWTHLADSNIYPDVQHCKFFKGSLYITGEFNEIGNDQDFNGVARYEMEADTSHYPNDTTSIVKVNRLNQSIKLYPNPTDHVLTIAIADIKESAVHIEIQDMMGKTLKKISVEMTQGTYTSIIDISNLSSGMYLLLIRTDKQTTVRKFLKE